jgi:hypothetical protein
MIPKRRIETKASRTASYTCFARGCATREKDPHFRGPDYLAEVMFPLLPKLAFNLLPLRKFLMRKMFPPGIYEYVLARTKVMDSAFVEALEARFAQIVLLGADFDTRALRFADRHRGTKVFELDAAATQQPKIEILHRKKVRLPQELTIAPIDFDPLPLAGLLYCGNHDIPRQMYYNNRREEDTQSSKYTCSNSAMKLTCAIVSDYVLDGPIGEAVISQIALPDLVEQILGKLTNEYEQAKEQAASYRREMKRLNSEVDNLWNNLTNSMAKGILSDESIKTIDVQIQSRLARIQELADLEKQPIGAAIGVSIPGQADVELIQSFLENLGENWVNQPNGLKNAFLRLLLDKIIIWPDATTIRAKLIWHVGLEQEILIHRPPLKYKPWHKAEVKILRQHYATTSKEVLLAMLPNRTWISIIGKAVRLGLVRNDEVKEIGHGKTYSEEEDRLIRRFYEGEISQDEIIAMTGRKLPNIRRRARKLGLKYYPPKATWEWLEEESKAERSISTDFFI